MSLKEKLGFVMFMSWFKEGSPMYEKVVKNWQTTFIGFAAAFVFYLQTNGGKFPENGQEWSNALIAALIQCLGIQAPNVMSKK